MYELGSIAAFEKLGLTPATMDQMLATVKRMQVKGLQGPLGEGYTGLPSLGRFRADVKEAVRPMASLLNPSELQTIKSEVSQQMLQQMPVQGNAIIGVPRGGGVQRFFNKFRREHPYLVSEAVGQGIRTPEQHKAFEAVIKGHELAETQVKGSPLMLGFGHRSPEVILREHNMIQTLPAGNEPVAETMRAMRATREAPMFEAASGGAFQYGQSPRLSRHGRKRMLELMEKHYAPQLKQLDDFKIGIGADRFPKAKARLRQRERRARLRNT
jgi:hypothetical protein